MQHIKDVISSALGEPYKPYTCQRICADELYQAMLDSPKIRSLPLMARALESLITKPLKQSSQLVQAALISYRAEEKPQPENS